MKGGTHRIQNSTGAYSRQVTHEGLAFKERRKQKVQCLKCGGIVGRVSCLTTRHQMMKSCVKASATYAPPTHGDRACVAAEQLITPILEPQQYTCSIPRAHGLAVACPVPGCPFTVRANASSKSMDMRKHFRQRRMEDGIVVQEEGPLPQCRLCGLFVRNANSDIMERASVRNLQRGERSLCELNVRKQRQSNFSY